MKNIHFGTRSVPWALLALCLIAFGLLIPWLGFYWDDWPSVWFLHFFGSARFVDVFASDRPLLGRLFWLTTSILGESRIAWQLFGFLTRCASALVLWWALSGVWPKQRKQVTWVALLFVVYPGFEQQFISVTYSHVFILLTAFFFSLGAMVWAFRKPRWFWLLMVFSWIADAYCLFSVEYFFGLELMRPVLLWLVIAEKEVNFWKRLRQVLLYWLPYLIIGAAFLYWRIFLHVSPRGSWQLFDALRTSPQNSLLNLVKTIFSDMVEVSAGAWGQAINLLGLKKFGLLPTLVYAVVVILTASLFVFYLVRYHEKDDLQPETSRKWYNRWSVQAILIGLFALFIGGWPIWGTDLKIGINFPGDRFTISMMLGVSLLLVGIVDLIPRRHFLKVVIIGLLIGLAVGKNYRNANLFRREWNAQKNFFWQLTWRAPGIHPGTAILASELPFEHFSDNSLTAPLNWTYSPDGISERMSYLLYAIESRLGLGLKAFG